MKKFLLALLCIPIVCINIKAQQTPFLQWQKTYGGSNLDWAYSIQQTKDGGYVIAGFTSSKNGDVKNNHGGMDYWVVKTDVDGNIKWQKTYGGSKDDVANSVQQTKDGGYIIAGYTYSNDGDVTGNHGNGDYWIVKIDDTGDIEWQTTYGGSNLDWAYSIQQTTDDGYIVAGYSRSNNGEITGNHGGADYWIIKLGASGNIQWQKALGGSKDDEVSLHSIQQTTDTGFIVAGYSYSSDGNVTGNHGGADNWIVKLDASGNIQWQKNYGGSKDDIANSVQQTGDRGYIIAGSSNSNDGDVTGSHGADDYWLVKLDALGNMQWEKALGGSSIEGASSVQQTADSGYILAGNSWSKNGDATLTRGLNNFWIVKVDSIGILKWQKSLGGSNFEGAYSVMQTNDHGYIAAGDTWSNDGNVTNYHGSKDFWVVKLSPETLNDNIHINAYHRSQSCSSTNSISCTIKDSAKNYIVRLYRFGVLYDSALNVTGHVSFHNLPSGAYYATATDVNGVISYSSEIGVVPSPYNLNTTNITTTTAKLNWTGFDCANTYKIQFRKQGDTTWREKITTDTTSNYVLSNLQPATIYVWRIASEKRKNGIKATGKFSDSVIFSTEAIAKTSNNLSSTTLSSNQLNISPNPAKNYFVINFKDQIQKKLNAILYNENGKAIWSSGLINASALNNKTVNTTLFARGMYYLKLTDENGKLISAAKVVISN